jgi:hypothetical protein
LLFDDKTANTYYALLHGSDSEAVTAQTGNGPITQIGATSSSRVSSSPLFRVDQTLVIESAPYRYIVSRLVFFRHPTLTLNGRITFAVSGNIVYLRDEGGREFRTRLFQKILQSPPPLALAPPSIAALPGPLHLENRKTWASTSGPDQYAVLIDGDFIYADQIIQGRRWFKVDAKRSGSLYVGKVHFGEVDEAGRTCMFEGEIDFRLVTNTRIEGRMLAYPLDAQLDFSTCRYSKPKENKIFAWVLE